MKFHFGGIIHGTGNKTAFLEIDNFQSYRNNRFCFVFKYITVRILTSLHECNHHIRLSEVHPVCLSSSTSFVTRVRVSDHCL